MNRFWNGVLVGGILAAATWAWWDRRRAQERWMGSKGRIARSTRRMQNQAGQLMTKGRQAARRVTAD